ncbi:MAG: alanine racemase [Crocinitomicaceae bacterium]|nr:alanine racemase [Crocinitomicaceae bacterium]
MIDNSYIEINIPALKNNLNFIQSMLGDKCELVSVVKGNAYGHGIENFVPAVAACGVKSFAVFSAYEAKKIVDIGLELDRVVIMGYIDDDQLEWAIENDVEIYMFDLLRLSNATLAASKLNKKVKIHIEVETGLNRTGFDTKELKKVFQFIEQNHQQLEIKGVCSHLAGAENIANYYRIKQQMTRFNQYLRSFKEEDIGFGKSHLACSAAMMNYPATIKDMVRIGIMQYGLWPSKEVKMAYVVRENIIEDPLKPVLSWKSKVMSTKYVKMGEYIGYGSSLLAEQDMRIATVPVGYADGFARSLSNQGKVLIAGHRLDVISIVNMNLFVVDISNVDEIQEGDEVVMIGDQEDQSVSVASFSDFSSQLNYELLTRLPNDIPRIITN